MSQVLREDKIKAVRKQHLCIGCMKHIHVGKPAVTWVGINDGDFNSVYYHPECREAEIALNDLHDYRFYDDWLQLCEAESEDYPFLKKEHPIAYKRMMMTREQHDKEFNV